jgi:hypothetical protein
MGTVAAKPAALPQQRQQQPPVPARLVSLPAPRRTLRPF